MVKSLKKEDHVTDLREMFALLRKYNMKLNPANCAFGVGSGKFIALSCFVSRSIDKCRPLFEALKMGKNLV